MMIGHPAVQSPPKLSDWWNPAGSPQAMEMGAAPYRRLALQLRHELFDAGLPRSILLTQPSRSTLPARAALLLAYSLAEELGQSVLLVDACGTQPDLSRLLGCEHLPGYAQQLASADPSQLQHLQRTSHPRVHFMPCGTGLPAHAGRSDAALAPFLAGALAGHDLVLVHGGSVLHDTVALSVAPHVSLALMLPVENESLVADLDAAQKALRFCKARQLAVVMLTAGRSSA